MRPSKSTSINLVPYQRRKLFLSLKCPLIDIIPIFKKFFKDSFVITYYNIPELTGTWNTLVHKISCESGNFSQANFLKMFLELIIYFHFSESFSTFLIIGCPSALFSMPLILSVISGACPSSLRLQQVWFIAWFSLVHCLGYFSSQRPHYLQQLLFKRLLHYPQKESNISTALCGKCTWGGLLPPLAKLHLHDSPHWFSCFVTQVLHLSQVPSVLVSLERHLYSILFPS